MIFKVAANVVPKTEPILLPKSATVIEAARRMRELDVGAILVVEDKKLVGIFTDRDVSFRVVAAGLDPEQVTLSTVMTPNPQTVQAGETVLLALERMATHHFRHLPVYDGEELAGVVAVRDILADATRQISRELVHLSVDPPPDCRVATDIMRVGALITLAPDVTVRRAAEAMKADNVSAVLITQGDLLQGIFTERDVSLRVVSEAVDPGTAALSEVMSADPVTACSGESCGAVVEKMIAGHFRHVPVKDDNRLAGILSIRDLYAYIRHTLETRFETAMIERARDMSASD